MARRLESSDFAAVRAALLHVKTTGELEEVLTALCRDLTGPRGYFADATLLGFEEPAKRRGPVDVEDEYDEDATEDSGRSAPKPKPKPKRPRTKATAAALPAPVFDVWGTFLGAHLMTPPTHTKVSATPLLDLCLRHELERALKEEKSADSPGPDARILVDLLTGSWDQNEFAVSYLCTKAVRYLSSRGATRACVAPFYALAKEPLPKEFGGEPEPSQQPQPQREQPPLAQVALVEPTQVAAMEEVVDALL